MRKCPLCDLSIELLPGRRKCSFCGLEEEGDHACANGHYTCRTCRSSVPSELVERICVHSKHTDPQELAELVTSHPIFNQYGPQYHIILGPVLVAVLANLGHLGDKEKTIQEAVERSKIVPELSCAQRGLCGAAVGAGVAVSLLSRATPVSSNERSLALAATARALDLIAKQSGPRCCPQSVHASIEAAWEIVQEYLKVRIPIPGYRCRRADRLSGCKKDICPYYEP